MSKTRYALFSLSFPLPFQLWDNTYYVQRTDGGPSFFVDTCRAAHSLSRFVAVRVYCRAPIGSRKRKIISSFSSFFCISGWFSDGSGRGTTCSASHHTTQRIYCPATKKGSTTQKEYSLEQFLQQRGKKNPFLLRTTPHQHKEHSNHGFPTGLEEAVQQG